jgi:hypothetical protein
MPRPHGVTAVQVVAAGCEAGTWRYVGLRAPCQLADRSSAKTNLAIDSRGLECVHLRGIATALVPRRPQAREVLLPR